MDKKKESLDEAKDFLHSILDHSESLSVLHFYAKLKNGAEFSYKHDSEKIAREKRKDDMNGVELFSAVAHTVAGAVAIIALVLFIVFGTLSKDGGVILGVFIALGVTMTMFCTFAAIAYYLPAGRVKRVFIRLRVIFSYALPAAFVLPMYFLPGITGLSISMYVAVVVVSAFGAIGDLRWGRRFAFMSGVVIIITTWLHSAFAGILGTVADSPMLFQLCFGLGCVFVTIWAVCSAIKKSIFVPRNVDFNVRDIASIFIALAVAAHFWGWLAYFSA